MCERKKLLCYTKRKIFVVPEVNYSIYQYFFCRGNLAAKLASFFFSPLFVCVQSCIVVSIWHDLQRVSSVSIFIRVPCSFWKDIACVNAYGRLACIMIKNYN